MQWPTTDIIIDTPCKNQLCRVVIEHHLYQLTTQPTWGDSILDLVFVSDSLAHSDVMLRNIIAGFNHASQLLNIHIPHIRRRYKLRQHMIMTVCAHLNHIDWTALFNGCLTTNDYACHFTTMLSSAINNYSQLF